MTAGRGVGQLIRVRVTDQVARERRIPTEVIGNITAENPMALQLRVDGRLVWIPRKTSIIVEGNVPQPVQATPVRPAPTPRLVTPPLQGVVIPPKTIQPFDGTRPMPSGMEAWGINPDGSGIDLFLPGDMPDLPPVPEPNTKTTGWEHQLQSFQVAWHHPGAGLWLDMGCGKSWVVVALASTLPDVQRILIVCPKSVVGVWRGQFSTHAGREFLIEPLIKGTVEEKTRQANEALELGAKLGIPVIIVTNFESAWRPPFGPTRHPTTHRMTDPGWAVRADFDMVVCDESQNIKTPSSRRSRFFERMVGAGRRLCLSGTPIAHNFTDLWGQYRFIDPNIFGDSFYRFRQKYAVMGGFQMREVKGVLPEMAPVLAQKIYSVSYRVTDDVLDLPEQTDITKTVVLNPRARRLYQEIEKTFYAEVEDGTITASNALVKALRLQQMTSGFITLDNNEDRTAKAQAEYQKEIDTAKKEMLTELLDSIPPGEKVVVFCNFIHDLDVVKELTENPPEGGLKRRYGEISGRRKDLTIDSKFPEDIDVEGVQIRSGGTGIDLTAARYAIYYSVGYSFSDYRQSRKRVHRPGQTRPVTYYHLIAGSTIDVKVYRALEKKADVVRFIMDHRGVLPDFDDGAIQMTLDPERGEAPAA